MKTLTITVEVQDDIEAYQIVSNLGFEHQVRAADLDGYAETFDVTNKPAYFLRDNKKNTLPMLSKDDIDASANLNNSII
jgi:hypothetical protein